MHAPSFDPYGAAAASLDELLEFVCVSLQLTPTQHSLADDRYHSIGGWLEAAPYGLLRGVRNEIYSQGSLRIGATTKPILQNEFDLDIVSEFQLNAALLHPPTILLDAVEARMKEHGTYRSMVRRLNRCIRVEYADDFHLDILPACPDPNSPPGSVLIPDWNARAWRWSNPKGFADWFCGRAVVFRMDCMHKAMAPLPASEPSPVKAVLKKVVQLIKRHRDIEFRDRCWLAPVSIVLTTLAGLHYDGDASLVGALERVLVSIAVNLPPAGRLQVFNPTNSKELLSERWESEPGSYEAFKAWLNIFILKLAQLRRAEGLHNVVHLLREMFGEGPAEAARKAMVDRVEDHRRRERLAIDTETRSLVLATTTQSRQPTVRTNTFYGD